MRKILLLSVLMFLFSSVAHAAEQFSISDFTLSMSPQQVFNLGHEKKFKISSRTMKSENKEHKVNTGPNRRLQYEYPIIAAVFQFPEADIWEVSRYDGERSIEEITVTYSSNPNYRAYLEITLFYLTTDDTDTKPFFICVTGQVMDDIYDVFTDRYGHPEKIKYKVMGRGKEHEVPVWKNDNEVAIYTPISFYIVDTKAFSKFVGDRIAKFKREALEKKNEEEAAKKAMRDKI